jgi:hypothetical protein
VTRDETDDADVWVFVGPAMDPLPLLSRPLSDLASLDRLPLPDLSTLDLRPSHSITLKPIAARGLPDGWEEDLRQFLAEHDPEQTTSTGDRPATQPASATTAHVFISYAREDQEYVDDLDRLLTSAGITTWVDRRRIGAGDRWDNTLREALDACSALVVVMTPTAEESRGVRREILYAEDESKPIVPVLLDGKRFWYLAEIQYEDVRDGGMPGDEFIDRLRRLMSG